MKLKVRTLAGAAKDYEVKETDTVRMFKEEVAARNNVDVSQVRLAYSARVLKDEDTIEACHLKEGATIIAVFSKPKASAPAPAEPKAPEPTPAAPAPAAAAEPAAAEPAKPAEEKPAEPEKKPEEKPEEKPAEPEKKPEEKPAEPVVQEPVREPVVSEPAAPAPAHGGGMPVDETKVDELVSMGFDRDQSVRALRLAYNNSERAVQFLCEGLPDEHDDGGAPDMGDDDEPGGAFTAADAFQMLTSNPQFLQLRTLIQQNPAMLEPLLNQIKQTNIDVYNIIMENRDAFSAWLSGGAPAGGAPAGGVPAGGVPAGGVPAGGVPAGGAPAGGAPRGGIRLNLSPEDRSAIESLCALGFDQGAAAQAYFACDKNVELAANLLFNGGF